MKLLLQNEREFDETKKKTLIVSPHADDEVLGCFGYIDKEVKKGNIVDVVLMAVGSYKKYNDEFIEEETKIEEVKSCHAFLGIRKTMIYSDKESQLEQLKHKDIVSFFDEILKEEYDTVFIPYPSNHIDHQITYNTVSASLRLKEGKRTESEIYIYEYPFIGHFDDIQGGAVYLEMTVQDLERKNMAFRFYKSQQKRPPSPLNYEGIATLSRMRGMEAGIRYAEKYYLQKKIIRK